MAAVIWGIVVILAVIGEAMTIGLFLGTVAVAALVAAVASVFLPVEAQVAVFAVVALLGLAFVRPVVIGMLGIDSMARTGDPSISTRLMGRRAVVTREIEGSEGQIRIGQSEFWTARSADPDELLPVGARVSIAYVDGLTAIVEPLPAAEPAPPPQDSLAAEQG